jgi:putative exosortase-associated protein (TIGR04073 family)
MKGTSLSLAAAALLVPALAFAHRTADHDRLSHATAVDKMGRGLAGMTTSFLELPGNIAAESREGGATAGATIGVAKGIGMIPVRTLVGVYEFVTAPFPVPEGYEPIIQPEYPWDYFDEHEEPARVSRSR